MKSSFLSFAALASIAAAACSSSDTGAAPSDSDKSVTDGGSSNASSSSGGSSSGAPDPESTQPDLDCLGACPTGNWGRALLGQAYLEHGRHLVAHAGDSTVIVMASQYGGALVGNALPEPDLPWEGAAILSIDAAGHTVRRVELTGATPIGLAAAVDGRIALLVSAGQGGASINGVAVDSIKYQCVVLLDAEGGVQRVAQVSGLADNAQMAFLPNGTLVLAGKTREALSVYDAIVRAWTASGDDAWSTPFGIANHDEAVSGLAIDPNGLVLVAGYHQRMFTVGSVTLGDQASSFVMALDGGTGNALWGHDIPLLSTEPSLALLGEDPVVGAEKILRFAPDSATPIWSLPMPPNTFASLMASDGSGVTVAGTLTSSAVFPQGTLPLRANEAKSAFVAHIDAAGSFQNAFVVHGLPAPGNRAFYTTPVGLAASPSRITLTGYFSAGIELGFGPQQITGTAAAGQYVLDLARP